MRFSDHFSGHAEDYARYRPTYPAALFSALSSLVSSHTTCWDCATGNGQAATELAEIFADVVATDASAEQIANAVPHPRVTYRVAPAESSGLPDRWADLVTVGQALHWFDQEKFFEEAARVGKSGGAVAIWAYDLFEVPGAAALEAVCRDFHASVEAYWPLERAIVTRRYTDVLFPFEEIPLPPVAMTAAWSLERVLGYLSTWSAVKRCEKETGRDPVGEFEERLAAAWGDPAAPKTISWPLIFRAGRLP